MHQLSIFSSFQQNRHERAYEFLLKGGIFKRKKQFKTKCKSNRIYLFLLKFKEEKKL